MSKDTKAKNKGGMGGGPAMGAPVQKAKNFKETLNRLLGCLKPERTKLIAVLLFAILSTLFSIYGPKVMGNATTKLVEGIQKKAVYYMQIKQAKDAGDMTLVQKLASKPVPTIDFDAILKIIIFLIALYALSSLFNFVMGYIMSGVSQRTVYTLRNDVNEKLSKLPLKYFDTRTHGEILSIITNDLDNIGTTLQQSLTQLITSLVTIIGILFMMFSISPILALISIVTLPVSAVLTVLIAKKSQKYFKGQQDALGQLNGHVEEMYSGHVVVKAFGHEKTSIEEFNAINEELYESGWKAQFMSGVIWPSLNFVSNVGYVLISIVGGLLVTKGQITIGNIQSFIQYSKQFTQPIIQTANISNVIQSTIASAERVFDLLDENEEIPDAIDNVIIENPKGTVDFKNVKFGYKEDKILMHDITIHVEPGQTVAVVGPTGAGKTTLINLLMRFYELNGGVIMVDGVDIKQLKRGDLRTMFGMVLQDTWLFNGSIRDNIAYGKEGATEEEIISAAKAAHAHHFIKTLPQGYNTVLNEEASNISQGQKQLLTIARAILANPTILILDEATSSVDTRTEVLIQKAMNTLMEGRTSFVIAHRLSTIRDANKILVMKNGDIIEQGSHDELMNQNGFYKDLYNSQFAGPQPGEAI